MSSTNNAERHSDEASQTGPAQPKRYAARDENGHIKHDAEGNTVYQDHPAEKYSSYYPYEKERAGQTYPWTPEQRNQMTQIAELQNAFNYEELEKAGKLPPGEAQKALNSGVPDMYAIHKYRDAVAHLANIPDRDHYRDIDLSKKDAPYSAYAQEYMKAHKITPEMLNDPSVKAQTQLDVQAAIINSFGSPSKYHAELETLNHLQTKEQMKEVGKEKFGIYSPQEQEAYKQEQVNKQPSVASPVPATPVHTDHPHNAPTHHTETHTPVHQAKPHTYHIPPSTFTNYVEPSTHSVPAQQVETQKAPSTPAGPSNYVETRTGVPSQFQGIDLGQYGIIGFAGQNTMSNVNTEHGAHEAPKQTTVTQEVQQQKAAAGKH